MTDDSTTLRLPSFLSWLDRPSPGTPYSTEDFYHILRQINRDYYYNQYHSPLFSGVQRTISPPDSRTSRVPTPIRRRSQCTLFEPTGANPPRFFFSSPQSPDSRDSRDSTDTPNTPSPPATSKPYVPRKRVPPLPLQLTVSETNSTDLVSPESPGMDEGEPIPILDPVESIADLLSLLDRYDPLGKYTINLRQLSNIREELTELNSMIGMSTLKRAILHQLIYFIQGLHEPTKGATHPHLSGDFKHTVIYGPPGTGKTEIAKIIGRMYSKLGILKNNVFKKVTRNDLVAGYLGQTAIKTKNVIHECLGGVLFIDEAYSLSNNNDLDSFSRECIDTLCEALSDHKAELMVIIAGYENELNQHFFGANRGLESRFIWRFRIDSYTPVELEEIFRKKAREGGWEFAVEEGAKPFGTKWFEKHNAKFRHFGRDMEILFFYSKIAHSRRVFGQPTSTYRKITGADVETGFAMFLENTTTRPEVSTTLYGMYV